MIRLDTINRTILLSLGSIATTSQLPIIVCYSDKSGSQYTGATQLSISNSITSVTICNSPLTATVRDIDSINVYNADSVINTVSISYNDNGSLYPISKAILHPGDSLRYTHSDGWSSVDITGSVKTSVGNAPNPTVVGIQVNMGVKPIIGGIFNIIGTGFVVGKAVMISQASGPYTGKGTYRDEIEMDQITIAAVVINTTTIQCNWGSDGSYIKGFLGFNYWISN